jgi:hypothetical protein
MADVVQLFGIEFTINTDGSLSPPASRAGLTGTLAAPTAANPMTRTAQIDGKGIKLGTHLLDVHLALPCVSSTDGSRTIWSPLEQTYPGLSTTAGTTPTHRLYDSSALAAGASPPDSPELLQSGFFQVQGDQIPLVQVFHTATAGVIVAIPFPNVDTPAQFSVTVGLSIEYYGWYAVSLADPDGALILPDDALSLEVKNLGLASDMVSPVKLSSTTHLLIGPSDSLTKFPLTAAIVPTFAFEPQSSDVHHFHVAIADLSNSSSEYSDFQDAAPYAALGLSNHHIHLDFDTDRTLTGIRAHPPVGQTSFNLHTFALSDVNAVDPTANELVHQVGAPLPLHILPFDRTGGRNAYRVGTLLHGPTPLEGISATIKTAGSTAIVHSLVAQTRFTSDPKVTLHCNDRTPLDKTVVGIHESIASELTMPKIVLASAKVNVAKPGDTHVASSATNINKVVTLELNSAGAAAGTAPGVEIAGKAQLPLPLIPRTFVSARASSDAQTLADNHYAGLDSDTRQAVQYHIDSTEHETHFTEKQDPTYAPITVSAFHQTVADAFSKDLTRRNVTLEATTASPITPLSLTITNGQAITISAPEMRADVVDLTTQTPPNKYQLDRAYSKDVNVKLTIDGGKTPQYLKILPAMVENYDSLKLQFSADVKEFQTQRLSFILESAAKPVLSALKLSTDVQLVDVLSNLYSDVGSGTIADLLSVVDPVVLTPQWTGLFFNKVPLAALTTTPQGEILAALTKGIFATSDTELGLKGLTYLAITAAKAGSTGSDVSVFARFDYDATVDNPAAQPSKLPTVQSDETSFFVESLHATWADSKLVTFEAQARLDFYKLFSISTDPKDTQASQTLKIVGRVDRTTQTIRFLGELPSEIKFLEMDPGSGPIAWVGFKSAEIVFSNGAPAIDINGEIALQEFSIGPVTWKPPNDQKEMVVQFSGLRLKMPDWKNPDISALAAHTLDITYPNLSLTFDAPPLNLGIFQMLLRSLDVDWSGGFDWNSLANFDTGTSPASLDQMFIMGLRLQLMKMPQLSLGGIDQLLLDLAVGIRFNGRSLPANDLRVGISAFSFKKLSISLLRFLEVTADSVALVTESPPTKPGEYWIEFDNVSVTILGKKVIDGLEFYLFPHQGPGGTETGFIGYMPTDAIGGIGPFTIHWALIAHNVRLDPELAKNIITRPTGLDKTLGAEISKAAKAGHIIDDGSPALNDGGWTFAAGIEMLGIFTGKFLFADNAYYGIQLSAGFLDAWFGMKGATITVAYIKGNQPGDDEFIVSIPVPNVLVGAVNFMGGLVGFGLQVGGGFSLDIGFPQIVDGIRDWDEAFGAFVTPYQARGGFYIETLHVSAPASLPGGKPGLIIGGGYAVEFGLGAAAGGGVFTVTAYAGVFFTVEGAAYIVDGDVKALRLVGSVGIVASVDARLNFWIISAEIKVTLVAEASVALNAYQMPAPYDQIAGQANRITLDMDLSVQVRASASACIGCGFIHICASIDVSVGVGFHYSVVLKDG